MRIRTIRFLLLSHQNRKIQRRQFARWCKVWYFFYVCSGERVLVLTAKVETMTDPILALNVGAVVGIHYIWRAYHTWVKHREKNLRERVAYMLWTAAQHAH